MEQFPVIDVQLLRCADEGELRKVLEACKDWGFFQVTNHGIKQELLNAVADASQRFFNLPLHEKLRVSAASSSSPLGFVHESQQGGILEHRESLLLVNSASAPNKWPQEPTNFRVLVEELLNELGVLAMTLVQSLFKSLNLPMNELYSSGFDGYLSHFYPAVEDEGLAALCEHKDNSILTLVYQQNDVHGLEVLRKGEWAPLQPIPGAFIANIGDTVEAWTNGELKSVSHRVVANRCPPGRYSASYFVSVKPDMLVAPLKQFTEEVNKAPRFRPFVHKDYVAIRLSNKQLGNRKAIFLDNYSI